MVHDTLEPAGVHVTGVAGGAVVLVVVEVVEVEGIVDVVVVVVGFPPPFDLPPLFGWAAATGADSDNTTGSSITAMLKGRWRRIWSSPGRDWADDEPSAPGPVGPGALDVVVR